MAPSTKFLLLLFILSLCFFTETIKSDDDCVYKIYVKTRWFIGSGTDSIIGLKLYDMNGSLRDIRNLTTWGLMGPNHDYFKFGNLDIFSWRGSCLDGPVCAINVTLDGSGILPAWYCEYVKVTSPGPYIPYTQQNFMIKKWIAKYISPFELWAYKDNCKYDPGEARFKRAAHHDAKLVKLEARFIPSAHHDAKFDGKLVKLEAHFIPEFHYDAKFDEAHFIPEFHYDTKFDGKLVKLEARFIPAAHHHAMLVARFSILDFASHS